jgi:hypothetical protein
LGYNTWKCHNELPYIVILNKQKCLFFFLEKCKTGCQTGHIWGLVAVEGAGFKFVGG